MKMLQKQRTIFAYYLLFTLVGNTIQANDITLRKLAQTLYTMTLGDSELITPEQAKQQDMLKKQEDARKQKELEQKRQEEHVKKQPPPTYGVALMLQVADTDRQLVDEKIYKFRHPLHTTIAYIETTDRQSAKQAEQLGKKFLEEQLKNQPYTFCVERCEPLFLSITGLTPTAATVTNLKNLNCALEKYLGTYGFSLNTYTCNSQYHPHMTLQRGVRKDHEYAEINKRIASIREKSAGQLCLQLEKVTTVINPLTPKPTPK